jgi:hypothetical protein
MISTGGSVKTTSYENQFPQAAVQLSQTLMETFIQKI